MVRIHDADVADFQKQTQMGQEVELQGWVYDTLPLLEDQREQIRKIASELGITVRAAYRWSTDEERERLLTTLQEFGPDKLLDALEKVRPPVGAIRTRHLSRLRPNYARNNPSPDGGRHVILATNRPVSFRELRNSSRRLQYQFTLIEIHIDKDGKGEGKLVPAARVSWDKEAKKIEIENYNALPVDLLNVTAKTP